MTVLDDPEGRAAAASGQAPSFSDEDVAAVAKALAHPARILPVMGTNNLDRIRRFGDAFRVAMDRETWFELYEAALGREVA